MEKQNFNLDWEYTEASGVYAMQRAEWEPVNLPHDLAISKLRSAGNPTAKDGGFAWSGMVTYRKKFQVPLDWQGKSIQLEFEGVYMNAEVSINRQLIALHPYGYTSFIVDLTPHLKFGQENSLVVMVNNSAQPNSRWYSGTGIYRHVWLRIGAEVHVQPWGVFVRTPQVSSGSSTIDVQTEINSTREGVILRSAVIDGDGRIVARAEDTVSSTRLTQTMQVDDARLWSIEDPYLYKLLSEVLINGVVVDREITSFGIRSIAVDAKDGFRLNGMPIKLRGGCIHHDHGLLGAASFDRAEERKVELLKASGFNAIRCAHNPPAPALLDACDRLGMLVIDESFDCWRTGKTANDFHLYFEDWWQRDTEAMLKRDRNHPSVIIWSIGNEVPERTGISDGYAWAHRQADFVRAMDPTRPVTSSICFMFEDFIAEPETMAKFYAVTDAQDFMALKSQVPDSIEEDVLGNRTAEFCESLDVVGYNYLYPRYEWDHQRFPRRVIVGTETYPQHAYDTWQATQHLQYVIGDFVWTAIDYIGESGLGRVNIDDPRPVYYPVSWPYHLAFCGDIDICGFKRPQSAYRDLLWGVRTAPFIAVLDPQLWGKKIEFSEWGWAPVVDSWSFPGQEGRPTRVDVYATDDEVELLINGVSVGRKPGGAAVKNKASFEVTYQQGIIEAVGYQDRKKVSRTSLQSVNQPAGLKLTADRPAIQSVYGDLSYVTIEVVDSQGNLVQYADPEITLEVTGAGKLLAIGSANPQSEDLYTGTSRRAWQGRMMAVICSTGSPGEIMLKAYADGLAPGMIKLTANQM